MLLKDLKEVIGNEMGDVGLITLGSKLLLLLPPASWLTTNGPPRHQFWIHLELLHWVHLLHLFVGLHLHLLLL